MKAHNWCRLIISCALMALSHTSWTMPSRPDQFAVSQPNGEKIFVQLRGDEWFSWAQDKDGYVISKDKEGYWRYCTFDSSGRMLATTVAVSDLGNAETEGLKSRMLPGFPSDFVRPSRPSLDETRALAQPPVLPATYNVLLILVDFSDLPATETVASFQDLMNSDSWAAGPCFREYYLANSYGQFTVHADVVGWFRAAQAHAYYGYGEGYSRALELRNEAVAGADAVVNFSDYDNDGDGEVDGLFIVHSGSGHEETQDADDIHSHSWSGDPQPFDGKTISAYTMEPEKLHAGHSQVGVFVHEYGHALGLPDLYDTCRTRPPESAGLGYWSLMAAGSWNPSPDQTHPAFLDAWSKDFLGYLEPQVPIVDLLAVTVPRSELSPTCFRLWTHGQVSSEYFLVEYRQPSSTIESLPGSGLLIYHVDEDVQNNCNEWYPGHTGAGHYKIALEQADNRFDLEHADNNGDQGDPFPGTSNNRTFGISTAPNSGAYDGSATEVEVLSIGSPGTNGISASLNIGIAPAEVGQGSENPTSFQACFQRNALSGQAFAISNVRPVGGGEIQEFQHNNPESHTLERGAILRIDGAETAFWVHGAIYAKYSYEEGGPTGPLGFPRTDEGEGAESRPHNGVRTRGRYNQFERGTINYIREPSDHPHVGQSFAVRAPFYVLFSAGDHGVRFSGWCGYPVSDAYFYNNALRQDFEDGYMYSVDGQTATYVASTGPSSLSVTALPDRNRLTWDDRSNDETAYLVYGGPLAGLRTESLLATLPPSSITYDDQAVQAGTTYRYYVVAQIDTVNSPPSNEAFSRLPTDSLDVFINTAEYFFDTDPGAGHGNLVGMAPGNETTLTRGINLYTASLLPGFHRLFLRYRDSRGAWSAAEGRSFYVTPPQPQGNLTINAAETYYDSDPGVGHGSSVSVIPDDEVTVTATPPMTGMQPGFHRMYLRYRTSGNVWSAAEGRSFYVTPPVPEGGQMLASAEYFLDSDPGAGQGHAVDFPDSSEVTLTEVVSPLVTTTGFHRLYLRYRTNNNVWSAAEGRSFYVTPPNPEGGQLLASAEYFLDNDPGTGQGHAVDFPDAAEVTLTTTVTPFTTTMGFHRLYLRYQTVGGVWSAAEGRSLYVTPALSGDSLFIAGGEIFIDSLGNYGDGTPMEADDGSFDENEEDMHKYQPASAFSLGQHFVHARVRDNRGIWSNVVLDSFTVAMPNEIRLVVLPEDSAGAFVRLAWTSFPSATEYHVHYDSVATGAFTSFITVYAPDTTAMLATPTGAGKRFFQVIAILPSRNAIVRGPEAVPATRESRVEGEIRKER